MFFQFLAIVALATLANAGHLGIVNPVPAAYRVHPVVTNVATPVAYQAHVVDEPSAPAHYDFSYSVGDPHTGDYKSQYESRRGDVVRGSYSLLDADGTKRTVDYSVEGDSGFNAVVRKEPVDVAHSPAVVGYAAPHVAPLVAGYAAPHVPAVASYAVPHVTPVVESVVDTHAPPSVTNYVVPALPKVVTPHVATHGTPVVSSYGLAPAAHWDRYHY